MGRKGHTKPGNVIAKPFIEYYALRKQWASTWLMRDLMDDQPDGELRPAGNIKHVFKGVFDTARWREMLGITEVEYNNIERKLWAHRKGNISGYHSIPDELVDRVLTNLGRPDLYQEWYGDQNEGKDPEGHAESTGRVHG
jgi:hypothetical protein